MPFYHGGHLTKDLYGSVPGVLGGAALPRSITDDFSADSGLWLDGALAPAALTVSGNKAVWTPTPDTELLTNGDMEAGDPPTGWDKQNGTLSASADVHAGSQACQIASTVVGTNLTRQEKATTAGTWLIATGWLKRGTQAALQLGIQEASGSFTSVLGANISTSYAFSRVIALATKTAMRLVASGFADTIGYTNLLDDASLIPLVAKTTCRLQRVYYPPIVGGAIWRTAHTVKGFQIYNNSLDWVGVYISENAKAKLVKVVNGTPTLVATQTITEVAGSVLQIVPNAAFSGFAATYGGSTVIAEQVITDFVDKTGSWYAGMINTYDPSNLATDAFGSFSAEAVVGSSPF